MTTLNEMWARLEQHQRFADQRGYGAAWKIMYEQRTPDAADAAVEDYGDSAAHRWEMTGDDVTDIYIDKFESNHRDVVQGCEVDDVGGLLVYLRKDTVVAVYDYENFKGWLRG
jgi:hypothetical protein